MTPGAPRLFSALFAIAVGFSLAAAADKPAADTSRIVSIGGDVTEILYALKADPKIVAVDTTSTYPASALKEKKSVGYMRALSTEGVLSTDPTLIIAGADAGPAEVVSALKASSVPYVQVPFEPSLEGVTRKIEVVGEAIGAQAEAEKLTKSVTAQFEALAERRGKIEKPVRALFVLAVQAGRAVAAGKGTAANAVIELAGAVNVAADMHGFKQITDEAVIDRAPDVVITMAAGAPGHDPGAILKLPAFKSTPAGQNERLIVMDGNYLLNFGPRAGQASAELLEALYPETAAAAQGKGQ
jgi:heme transport system substrate-binding protein